MTKEQIIRKLTSRKFLLSLVTTISGLLILIFGETDAIQQITSGLMTILPTIIYCVTEGMIDAASVSQVAETVGQTAENLGAKEGTAEVISNIGETVNTLIEEEDEE